MGNELALSAVQTDLGNKARDLVLEMGAAEEALKESSMKIRTIRGPWFSLGVHVDFKHRHVDIHFIWWVIVVGNTVDPVYCGWCDVELVDNTCPVCDTEFGANS